MKSVADELRQKTRAAVSQLSFDERLALAFELGDADLEIFCAAQGLDRRTAIRLLERRRQASRRPSACMTALIG